MLKKVLKRLMENRDPKTKLCFVHLAKTGGTSLGKILDRLYERKFSFKIHDWYNSLNITRGYESAGDIIDSESRLALLNYTLQQGYNLVQGHFFVNQAIIDSNPKYRFITVLRDPVDRMISNILYDQLHGKITGFDSVDKYAKDLDVFLESRRGDFLANLYGYTYGSGGWSKNPDVVIAEAVSCLKKFEFIGNLENVASIECEMGKLLGSECKMTMRNVTSKQVSENADNYESLRKFLKEDSIRDRLRICMESDLKIYSEISEMI